MRWGLRLARRNNGSKASNRGEAPLHQYVYAAEFGERTFHEAADAGRLHLIKLPGTR
jgi:hypothetical protein